MVEVDAIQGGRKEIRIALAPDLAVADDVEAGVLLRADGQQGRIVLGLGELGLGHAP